MLLIIDNYDSFTYNLVSYCQELGADTNVVYNDQLTLNDIKQLNPTHILLSPGPGNTQDSGITMDVIDYFHNKLPILGVCLGHQCIAQYFGGRVVLANSPMHGKTSKINHNQSRIFNNIDNNFSATRYHSLIVDNNFLPDCLNITAYSDDNEIMALEHKEYAIYGVQFHPESVLSDNGHKLLSNFLV